VVILGVSKPAVLRPLRQNLLSVLSCVDLRVEAEKRRQLTDFAYKVPDDV